MRAVVQAAVLALWLAAGAYGQEVRKAADWQKMYQDASAQLQAAQNRKAELAAENGRLTAKVTQLQHDFQTAQTEADSLGRQADALQDQTCMLRAFYDGWAAFLLADPLVSVRWKTFWGDRLPTWSNNSPVLFDPNWPLTAAQ